MNRPMNFDYYLFDLDNCLLYIPNPGEHFDNVLLKTFNKLSNKNILPSRDERNKFWSAGEDYLKLLKEGGITDLENFWKYFDKIDFEKRKILVEKEKIHLFRDVYSVLKDLQRADKKLAIISNTADYIVEYCLKEFKISHLFHECFGLGYDKDQTFAKPSPNGILTVLKKLNFKSNDSRAIMIGDSIADIFAAKRANIKACLIKRDLNKYSKGFNNWKYKPDFVIEHLDELFQL